MDLPKRYDPKVSERKWQEFWEKEKLYKFNPEKKGEIYSIDTPPPTVSGKMHIGHAFSYTQQDFIARFQRMRQKNVFYPFGTDDNGLPTDKLVEKTKKVRSTTMKRTEYTKLCFETIKELKPEFISDWKKIGMSCDFETSYSTIDPDCQKISQELFLELYDKELVKRYKSPVAWDVSFQSSIAQAEFENIEKDSTFNDIAFQTEDGQELIIATTRPELMAACVAVFYNPNDKRYQNLKGKHAIVPLFNLKVPILSDKTVEIEKGSGLMMVCTFGDKEDIDKYYRYKLDLRIIINKDGKLNELAKPYEGLKIIDARKKILDDLKSKGLLKNQKQIRHNVNVYEKSQKEVEFIVADQWSVDILSKKDNLIKLGNKINWYPSHMKARYVNWVENLHMNWCLSRQRHFGIPIPVWYEKDTGKVVTASKDQLPVDPTVDFPKGYQGDKNNLIPELDVLDTWATSSLSPLIAVKRHGLDEKKMLPMNLRPQAHDIIRTWAFYTIVRAYFHRKEIPWNDIMISGHALDPKGKKMSKSKGNVVDPNKCIEKYNTDSLRFWAAGSKLGDDLSYQEKDLVTGNKFITKLWNSSKFVYMHLDNYTYKDTKRSAFDKWILAKLHKLIKSSTETFEKYEYAKTKTDVEGFFWHDFCDYYLEIVKDRLYNPENRGNEAKEAAQATLHEILLAILKMFAPIMPHITEELYQLYYSKIEDKKSIHIASWPEYNKKLDNKDFFERGKIAKQVISAVRKYKALKELSLKAELNKIIIETKHDLKDFVPDLLATTKAKTIEFGKADDEISEGLKVTIKE